MESSEVKEYILALPRPVWSIKAIAASCWLMGDVPDEYSAGLKTDLAIVKRIDYGTDYYCASALFAVWEDCCGKLCHKLLYNTNDKKGGILILRGIGIRCFVYHDPVLVVRFHVNAPNLFDAPSGCKKQARIPVRSSAFRAWTRR